MRLHPVSFQRVTRSNKPFLQPVCIKGESYAQMRCLMTRSGLFLYCECQSVIHLLFSLLGGLGSASTAVSASYQYDLPYTHTGHTYTLAMGFQCHHRVGRYRVTRYRVGVG